MFFLYKILVLLSAEGVVKICDFGLSRLYDNTVNPIFNSKSAYSSGGADGSNLTMTTRVGTPAYMAPELAQVRETIDIILFFLFFT